VVRRGLRRAVAHVDTTPSLCYKPRRGY